MFEDFENWLSYYYIKLSTDLLTNIYLCWEFGLPSSTLLSISGHFKWFQKSNPLSQLTNLANMFWETPIPPPQKLFHFYGPVILKYSHCVDIRKRVLEYLQVFFFQNMFLHARRNIWGNLSWQLCSVNKKKVFILKY